MKHFFSSIIIFAFFAINISFAQTYGNEWIDFDKTYYKIQVSEDGVYRIGTQTLTNAGIPVSSISGTDLVLYAYGEEYPIYVSNNGALGSDDYIEFYGQKNRGQIDAQLYNDPETMQLNPEYSLFNDTMTYFLTWDNTVEHERILNIENDLNGELPDAEDYYMAEEKLVLSSKYNKPIRPGDHTSVAHFDIGEGFGSSSLENLKFTLKVDNVYEGVDELFLDVRTGSNISSHIQEIIFNNELIERRNFTGFFVQQYHSRVGIEKLKNSNEVKIKGLNPNAVDRSSASIVSISYPRKFVTNNENTLEFRLDRSNIGRYVEIELSSNMTSNYYVLDKKNHKRLLTEYDSDENKIRFFLPSSETNYDIIVYNSSVLQEVLEVNKYNFINLSSINANYLVITSEKLRTSEEGVDWPKEYAAFRESSLGGGYRPYVINVEDIYNQFSYGIVRHSIGIRNMGEYLKEQWLELKHVFIIGKGLDFTVIRSAESFSNYSHLFYVPTFGTPPADNLLFTKQGEFSSDFYVGRLAAIRPEQIKDYMEKAIANASVYESENTINNNPWTKKIIHLGGGSVNDKKTIKTNLLKLEDKIANNGFGGNVISYFKSSSEAISHSVSEDIITQINEGTSLIAFFGHSAVGSLDYSIGRAQFYDNKDRYPVFLSLGCLAGNIHTTGVEGISENYILTKDKGAVAFVASSFTAHIHKLYQLTNSLYEKMGDSSNGLTIGEGLSYALKKLDNGDYTSTILVEELTLHGDPAILLHTKSSPDYSPEFSSLSLSPNIVNAALDSFHFNIDITNLGRANQDSIYVKWRHINPDGDTLYENEKLIVAPKYKKSYSFSVPLTAKEILGENTIHFQVDSKGLVDEYPLDDAESNNYLQNENGVTGFSFFIIDNNLMPIYPKEFGIVNIMDLTLLASGSNVFLEDQKYLLEIDTSELFESVLDRTEIIAGGGLVSWQPDVMYEDGKVYYWRVSPDSIDANIGYVWNNSSFIFLENGSNGWNQSHYYQLKKNDFKDLILNKNKSMEYGANFLDVRLKNGYSNGPHKIEVFVSGYKYLDLMNHQSAPCIIVAAVDSLGDYIWNGPLGDYGSFNPTTGKAWEQPVRGFYYNTNSFEDRQNLINFVENIIPNDYNVFFYTNLYSNKRDLSVEDWDIDINNGGKSLYTVIEEQGATRIREFKTKGAVPYNFIFKKGASVFSEEIFEPGVDAYIETNTQIKGRWFEGKITSSLIGPASSWDKIIWADVLSETPENDTTYLTVFLLNKQRQIVDTLFNKTMDRFLSISNIDAEKFPYIKLVYANKDIEDKTAPMFNFWRVFFNSLPEAALNPALSSKFHADSIYQGDILNYNVTLSNITNRTMDSILIKYVITDDNNYETITKVRLAPLKENENVELNYSFNTKELINDFYFNVEVNPNEDQVEQYHFNNIGLKKVKLLKDMINPILNVWFDGIKIIDEDIVSPSPLIRVELKDDSPFMLTDNIDLFKVHVLEPNGIRKEIDLKGDEIIFYPAVDNSNKAYFEYRPMFTQNGLYTLYVKSMDASGNISGDNDYRIKFNVVLEQKVTSIINYPNPFSSSTQFIFTLTGAELPQEFKIQIISASGKVVKEISDVEMGNLHIGLNRSEYLWNGTDDFGDKLANGVYFYKVSMKKSDGEEYKHIDTAIDGFYTKGWGKLVIMR